MAESEIKYVTVLQTHVNKLDPYCQWQKTVTYTGIKDYWCLGLVQTGIMSFRNRQDRTPKFAGQVLSDWTKSGLIFSNILHTKYDLLILFRYGLVSKVLG